MCRNLVWFLLRISFVLECFKSNAGNVGHLSLCVCILELLKMSEVDITWDILWEVFFLHNLKKL